MAPGPKTDLESRVLQALEEARRARSLANEAADIAYSRFEATIQEVVGELIETQNLLEGTLTSSTEYSIIGKDLERRIVLWNEGARRNYGYTREEVLGRSSDFLHAPGDLESGHVEQMHRKALEAGHAEGKFRRLRKDGSIFTASVVLTRRLDRNGKPAGYLLISRDITREETALRELKETKGLLDNILASSTHYSVIAKDLERRIVMWNEGARRNYGYEAAEVMGRRSDFMHDASDLESGIVDRLHRQALKEGMAEGRFLRRRKDGTTFPASVVITRRTDADGKPVGYLLISRDVTKDIEAAVAREVALRKQDELEQVQRESAFKTRFLNMAAHELGTPLTSLRLGVEVLSHHPGDDDMRRKLDVVRRGTNRLVALAQNLVFATRLQAGRIDLLPQPLDVDAAVAGAVESARSRAQAAGIRLQSSLEAHTEALLDPERLRQVVLHLVDNALQLSPSGGTIHVSTRRSADQVLVAVSDSGVALRPGEEDRAFEPFADLHGATEGGMADTGLGLYIAKGLAELHGGSVEAAANTPGPGSTFTVRLPIRSSPAMQPAGTTPRGTRGRTDSA